MSLQLWESVMLPTRNGLLHSSKPSEPAVRCKSRFRSFRQRSATVSRHFDRAAAFLRTRKGNHAAYGHLSELTRRPPRSTGALLGLEGRRGWLYFNGWQSLPLRWKGIGRHPIPYNWQTVGQRGTFARKRWETETPLHPVNAIMNYAYAILESHVRIQVLSGGYDPPLDFFTSVVRQA